MEREPQPCKEIIGKAIKYLICWKILAALLLWNVYIWVFICIFMLNKSISVTFSSNFSGFGGNKVAKLQGSEEWGKQTVRSYFASRVALSTPLTGNWLSRIKNYFNEKQKLISITILCNKISFKRMVVLCGSTLLSPKLRTTSSPNFNKHITTYHKEDRVPG